MKLFFHVIAPIMLAVILLLLSPLAAIFALNLLGFVIPYTADTWFGALIIIAILRFVTN